MVLVTVLTATALTAPAAQADTVDVNIVGFAFVPDTVRVTQTDVVRWTNSDAVPHTSTSDTVGIWDSGNLNQGQSYSRTFAVLGEFPYHCTIHPTMKAVVIVEPVYELPSMTIYGAALLAMLLLITGYWMFRRKRSAQPA
jgi:plastocyanin